MTHYPDTVLDARPASESQAEGTVEQVLFGDADPSWYPTLRRWAEDLARGVWVLRTLEHCFKMHAFNANDRSRPRRQRRAAQAAADAALIHAQSLRQGWDPLFDHLVDVGIMSNHSSGITRELAVEMAGTYIEAFVPEGWSYETMRQHGITPKNPN